MYEHYFGFSENPFTLTPDPRYYFRSSAHANAFESIQYAVSRREGFIALTGEIGTGKTTLCRTLLEDLDRTILTALILNPPDSEEDFLRLVLQEFGVISRDPASAAALASVPRQALIDALNDFLLSVHTLGAQALVVIDEAQNVPPHLLEQIRLLSNLETDREKLLQVLLVGQPNLEKALGSQGLRQLDQRVSARCELTPFSRKETAAYVLHRLGVAGGIHVTFSTGALARVHGCTRGVPRLVNLVCDRALLAACADRADGVAARHIDQAAQSLGLARPGRLLLAWAR